MAVMEVRLFGDPVLRTPAEPVTEFDHNLETLVANMTETMYEHGGVGLAANQVGVLQRVFVFDCTKDDQGQKGHLINPVWEPVGTEKVTDTEGCLSIPGVNAETARYAEVIARGVDVHGKPLTIHASGLLARCIQHETDHLDGVLFLKRLEPEVRKQAMATLRAQAWFNQG